MNNFSDITDINPDQQLRVRLDIVTHGSVHYRLRLNGHFILDNTTELYLNLFAPIHLQCTIIDAVGDSALEIKNLSVNNLEVLPRYMHWASEPTLWLTKNEWLFSVREPFYPWYHKISGQGFIA